MTTSGGAYREGCEGCREQREANEALQRLLKITTDGLRGQIIKLRAFNWAKACGLALLTIAGGSVAACIGGAVLSYNSTSRCDSDATMTVEGSGTTQGVVRCTCPRKPLPSAP